MTWYASVCMQKMEEPYRMLWHARGLTLESHVVQTAVSGHAKVLVEYIEQS
jgi:hypothetical protein